MPGFLSYSYICYRHYYNFNFKNLNWISGRLNIITFSLHRAYIHSIPKYKKWNKWYFGCHKIEFLHDSKTGNNNNCSNGETLIQCAVIRDKFPFHMETQTIGCLGICIQCLNLSKITINLRQYLINLWNTIDGILVWVKRINITI